MSATNGSLADVDAFYVVPNYIGDEIDRVLDKALADVPDAIKDRPVLRSQLIDHFAKHGVIPEFSIQRKP